MTQPDSQFESEKNHESQITALAIEIHEISEKWMEKIEDFIDLNGGDLKLTIDDLKRVSNFLDAVIEAHPITYMLSEVMTKLELDEATLRKLFSDVGVDLDLSISDPTATITRDDMISLLADRAGSREGDLIADILRGGRPKVVWG